jgi:hypothetical protein
MGKTTMLGVAIALVSAAVACGGSDEPVGSLEPEVKSVTVPADVKALFEKIDGECAGNDNGFVTTYVVKSFDAAKIMSELKAEDKDKMGSDCSKERQYSTSREDAVTLFRKHLEDKLESTKECLSKTLSPAERATLDKFVSDPTNVGVFANVHAGGDNPEACTYYEFDVYRADGVHAQFVFNFTD